MKKVFCFVCALVVSMPVCSHATNHPVLRPLLPLQLTTPAAPEPARFGFFTPVRGPVSLSEDARGLLDDAVFWNWMIIGGFGASTLAFVVTHTVDRTIGGVLGLVSAGYWTASNFAAAFTHRKISLEIKSNNSESPRPVTAGVATLAGGMLGVGAMTAVSLIFGDTSGAAEVSAYVLFGLSAVAGGYGVFKTFEYASAAGTDLSFF